MQVKSSKLNEWVDSLPEGGQWWKKGNRGVYKEAYQSLVDAGWETERVEAFLEGLYHAVASEFGN